jgi:hypothetical protein
VPHRSTIRPIAICASIDRLFERLSTLDPRPLSGRAPKARPLSPLRFTPRAAASSASGTLPITKHGTPSNPILDRAARQALRQLDVVASLAALRPGRASRAGCADAVTARAVRRFIDGLRPCVQDLRPPRQRPRLRRRQTIARWLLDLDVERFTARESAARDGRG